MKVIQLVIWHYSNVRSNNKEIFPERKCEENNFLEECIKAYFRHMSQVHIWSSNKEKGKYMKKSPKGTQFDPSMQCKSSVQKKVLLFYIDSSMFPNCAAIKLLVRSDLIRRNVAFSSNQVNLLLNKMLLTSIKSRIFIICNKKRSQILSNKFCL